MFGIVLFGILGLALIAVGAWGAYRGIRVAAPASFDQVNIDRRVRAVRRGALGCVSIGALFVHMAVVSALGPHPKPGQAGPGVPASGPAHPSAPTPTGTKPGPAGAEPAPTGTKPGP